MHLHLSPFSLAPLSFGKFALMTELTMERPRKNLESLKIKNTLEILDNYLERAVKDELNIVEVLLLEGIQKGLVENLLLRPQQLYNAIASRQ